MKIHEIYQSIQGESTYAGQPCIFVRTSGCNLRCRWCDTEEAFEGGTEKTLETILQTVTDFGCPLLEITGGEPLLQPETLTLIRNLLDEGYQVLLETGGSLPIDVVDTRAVIILDIKCPSSGMSDAMHWANLNDLKKNDEIKFVIADEADYRWAKMILNTHQSLIGKIIHFSPVFGEMNPSQLADWILKDRLPVRLQMQLHKYIWNPSMKGV
ncbi:radical SAM protein [Nitrospira defluvii]|nr:radical SAM protein [Nitrospira defluvii]